MLAVIGRGGWQRVSRITIVHGEEADLPWSGAAGEARADFGILDGTAEEEIIGRLKVRRILKEERTQLGKEHFESLIDGDPAGSSDVRAWLKSGFTVTSSVKESWMMAFMSAPARSSVCDLKSGAV